MSEKEKEIERARDEQLIAAFAVVLTHPTGFCIDHATNAAWIARDGERFCVHWEDVDREEITAENFDDLRAAIGYYLDLCELGQNAPP